MEHSTVNIDTHMDRITNNASVQTTTTRRSIIVVTPTIVVLCLLVFAFMAPPIPSSVTNISRLQFDVTILKTWGARYLPSLHASQWFTSPLIHASFTHLILNVAFIAFLGTTFEHFSNVFCASAVALCAALGGGFVSAAFESPCRVYLGASGITYGFAGGIVSFTIQKLVSKGTPPYPWLSWGSVVLIESCMLIGMFVEPLIGNSTNVSIMTHVGGFLGGQAISVLMMPWMFQHPVTKIKVLLIVTSLLELIFVLAITPIIVHTEVLKNTNCASL